MKGYDKVIFVSKGNTFSSPLVEAIYRDKAPNWLPESMSRGTVVLFFRADKSKSKCFVEQS